MQKSATNEERGKETWAQGLLIVWKFSRIMWPWATPSPEKKPGPDLRSKAPNWKARWELTSIWRLQHRCRGLLGFLKSLQVCSANINFHVFLVARIKVQSSGEEIPQLDKRFGGRVSRCDFGKKYMVGFNYFFLKLCPKLFSKHQLLMAKNEKIHLDGFLSFCFLPLSLMQSYCISNCLGI